MSQCTVFELNSSRCRHRVISALFCVSPSRSLTPPRALGALDGQTSVCVCVCVHRWMSFFKAISGFPYGATARLWELASTTLVNFLVAGESRYQLGKAVSLIFGVKRSPRVPLLLFWQTLLRYPNRGKMSGQPPTSSPNPTSSVSLNWEKSPNVSQLRNTGTPFWT